MQKIFVCFTMLFISMAKMNSQPLARGEMVPEIVSDQLLNFSSPVFRLSDYKGKILIIDYWSFTCASCLKSFPHTDSLQQQFKDDVQIVLVNMESKKETIELFEKFKKLRTKIRMPNLPMVTGDTVFYKYFPVRGLPMVVWVDPAGRFRYLTSGVNEKQLEEFIAGRKPDIIEKNPKTDFKKRTSLIEQPNKAYQDDITYFSYIAHYVEGTNIGSFYKVPYQEEKLVRTSENSGSISELLIMAFGEKETRYLFREGINVKLEVKDTFKYVKPDRAKISNAEYATWRENFLFRYDCAIPTDKQNRTFEFMRQDICRYFDLDVRIEKRKMKCLALVKANDSVQWNGISGEISEKEIPDSIFYTRMSYADFFKFIQTTYYYSGVKYPIVDEVNYNGNVNLAFPLEEDGEFNVERITQQLKKYGLLLVEKECLTDVLVIREAE